MKTRTSLQSAIMAFVYLLLTTLGARVAHSQCVCFASLKYRPVEFGIVPSGYNHAFWWVGDSTGQHYTFDGGPSGSCPFSCGLLIDWPPFLGDTGHYADDNPSAPTTVTLGNVCTQVNAMYNFASDFNASSPAYALAGNPNSNTFAHEAANAAGFPGVSAPPSTIGW